MKIAIAGAGIAGLSSALALAKSNSLFDVEVFERHASPSQLGAGIQLGPNAFNALNAIDRDLAEQLKNQCLMPERVVMRDLASGKILSSITLGAKVRSEFGQPYGVMHRATLQDALLKSCDQQANVQVYFGRSFEDDKSVDLTIGADGLWSGLRQRVLETSEPDVPVLSSIAFRGLVQCLGGEESLANEVQIWVGPQAHVVLYPMKHPTEEQRVLNVAAFVSGQRMRAIDSRLPQRDQTSWATGITASQLIAALPKIDARLEGLLNQVSESSAWRVYAGPRLKKWYLGNVVLTGDAAHAMLPHLAQGAAFALEDAVSLAKQVTLNARLISASLIAFQNERMARCHRAQAAALRYQKIYHATGFLRFARNRVLSVPALAPSFGGLRWIYEWSKEPTPQL